MRLEESYLTIKNPQASMPLEVPLVLVGPVSHEKHLENVRKNSLLDIPWLESLGKHRGMAIVVGKGPSLAETVEWVERWVSRGASVFACNSAAKWLTDRGIAVRFQVLLDPQPKCADQVCNAAQKQLIASFCDPATFEKAKNPVLWHPLINDLEDAIPAGRTFTGIGGGITVLNSALCIATSMGFDTIHLHGADSSSKEGRHYVNDEDVNYETCEVTENGKTYETAFYLKEQVQVFLRLAPEIKARGVDLKVFGTGLLPDLFHSQPLEAH